MAKEEHLEMNGVVSEVLPDSRGAGTPSGRRAGRTLAPAPQDEPALAGCSVPTFSGGLAWPRKNTSR
jgi:hypothetical protein